MAAKTQVPGSVVRAWANSEAGQAFIAEWVAAAPEGETRVAPTVGKRGKFSQVLIGLFHAANKGQRYVEKLTPTIKISGRVINENGKNVARTVHVTPEDLRKFAHAEGLAQGERGKLPEAVKQAYLARPQG